MEFQVYVMTTGETPQMFTVHGVWISPELFSFMAGHTSSEWLLL
jgi:hypothetical protein